MCPELKGEVCEIGGIEPERIRCVDIRFCLGREYEQCRVYLSRYFISTGMAFRKVA